MLGIFNSWFKGSGSQASAASGGDNEEEEPEVVVVRSSSSKTRVSEDAERESSRAGSGSKARKTQRQVQRPRTPEVDEEFSDDELLLTSSTSRSRSREGTPPLSEPQPGPSRSLPTKSSSKHASEQDRKPSRRPASSASGPANGPTKPSLKARKQSTTASSSTSAVRPDSSPVPVVASRSSRPSPQRISTELSYSSKDKGKGKAKMQDPDLSETRSSTGDRSINSSTFLHSAPNPAKKRKREREVSLELEVAPHISPAKKRAKTQALQDGQNTGDTSNGQARTSSSTSSAGPVKIAPKPSPVTVGTSKDKGKGREVVEEFKKPSKPTATSSNLATGSKAAAVDDASLHQGEEVSKNKDAVTPAWPADARFTSLAQLKDFPATVRPSYAYWVLIRAAILEAAAEAESRPSTSASTSTAHNGLRGTTGVVGHSTIEDICKAICFRYPYYLTGFADGSLEKAIRAAIVRYRCFLNRKDAFGIQRYMVDVGINPLEKGGKAPKQSTVGDTSTVSEAADASLIESEEPQAVPVEPYRPKPLPQATHTMFATSLSHLPEIAKDQLVPFKLFTLVRAAILGSPFRRLGLDQIYTDIVSKYPQLVPIAEKGDKAELFLRQSIRDVLYIQQCFFHVKDGTRTGFYTVDLWTDPRTRGTSKLAAKKKTREGYYADVSKCSLEEIEKETKALQEFYEEKERRYARRAATLAGLEGPPQPSPAPVAPKPLVARPPFMAQPSVAQAGPSGTTGSTNARLSPEQKAVAERVVQSILDEHNNALIDRNPAQSVSTQARAGTPELEEPPLPPPSSKKKPKKQEAGVIKPSRYKPGTVALREDRQFTPELEDVTAVSSGASTSDPGSLEFSDPSRARKGSTNSLGPDTPIELSSGSSSGSGTERTRSARPSSPSVSPEPEPTAKAMPAATYVCGYTEHRTGKMCEVRFFNAEDRATHLRYTHGQRNDSLDLHKRLMEKAQIKMRETLLKKGLDKKKKKEAKAKAMGNSGAGGKRMAPENKRDDKKKKKSSVPVPVKSSSKKKAARNVSVEL